MPIAASTYGNTSNLISSSLESQLNTLLKRISTPVQLTCILDSSPKSTEMAEFINHICTLSEHLSCHFLSVGENPELDRQMDATMLPATGVSPVNTMPRIIFHGIPGGKEINSFASALLVVGGAGKPLDKYTLKDISKIKKTTELQICVSLGCQHCAELVSHAHRIAWENEHVCSHMIDAGLYPDLVKQYLITRVPLTVINRNKTFIGGKTMSELTGLLLIK